jgi:hypothetical protein
LTSPDNELSWCLDHSHGYGECDGDNHGDFDGNSFAVDVEEVHGTDDNGHGDGDHMALMMIIVIVLMISYC